ITADGASFEVMIADLVGELARPADARPPLEARFVYPNLEQLQAIAEPAERADVVRQLERQARYDRREGGYFAPRPGPCFGRPGRNGRGAGRGQNPETVAAARGECGRAALDAALADLVEQIRRRLARSLAAIAARFASQK